jgi:hypothetical protein
MSCHWASNSEVFRQNCEELLLASLRPSVHMEQLVAHPTDFYEIWYLSILQTISRENSSFIQI